MSGLMFESVVPETVAPRSRRLWYETLPLSLGLHAAFGAAVVVAGSWNVAFPLHSPKLYAGYSLAAEPPPPPPPPPPPVAARTQAVPQVKTAVAMPLVAPTIIPDEIPVVLPEAAPAPVAVEAIAAPGGVPGGEERGEKGGERGGQIGGTIGTIPMPLPPIVEVRRDQPLPMGAIAQDFPMYPESARTRGIEDTLIVRYLIGKDGRVKDVTVLVPPERDDFARETLSAMRYWRFHPYRDASGEIKEVSHELTVEFRLKKRKKS